MGRGERLDGRCAVFEHLLEEHGGNFVGVILAGKLQFFGEGVGLKPLQQLSSEGADNSGLSVVQMHIYKTRHDEVS